MSNAVAITQNVDQVALWSGNSRRIIYESYLNQVTERELKAYFAKFPPGWTAANVVAMSAG